MRIVDLFSGIGGLSLAASWVWGDSLDIACFCERDEFCQKVLRKHWPNVPIVGDVYELEKIASHTKCSRLHRKSRWGAGQESADRHPRIDILTAGFPCQPASTAGRRKGTADDRWLWPPLLAAIRQLKPRWLLLENVPGLLSLEAGLVFERCCTDLEAQGYEVQPLLIPACGVGAPHKREWLWIVANSKSQHCQWSEQARDCTGQPKAEIGNSDCHAANTGCQVPQERRGQAGQRPHTAIGGGNGEHWKEHWREVAARTCVRGVDDGIPDELDKNRVNRLKALGNSIVPQVAARIMMAIKAAD